MSPKSDRFSQKDDKFSLWQTLQSEEQSRTGCGYISRSYLQRNDEETYDGQADKLQTVELLSLTGYRDDLKKICSVCIYNSMITIGTADIAIYRAIQKGMLGSGSLCGRYSTRQRHLSSLTHHLLPCLVVNMWCLFNEYYS